MARLVLTVAALTRTAQPVHRDPDPAHRRGGVDFVPSSPRDITSFYGRWTAYLPAPPAWFRAQPVRRRGPRDRSAGSFNALVSRARGSTTRPARRPVTVERIGEGPAGRRTDVQLPDRSYRTLRYSDVPAPSGNRCRSPSRRHPGNIVLPLWFDAARGSPTGRSITGRWSGQRVVQHRAGRPGR